MIQRILLFILVFIITLTIGFGLPYRWLAPVLHYSGYYFILMPFVLWIALLLKILLKRYKLLFQSHYPAILLSIGLMALIFHTSPPQFKILADETNLVGVSMAMHKNKTVSLPVQSLALDYSASDYACNIDKRPFLFPFVISLIHAVIGYSPFNGFFANFILGISILFLFYLLISNIFSRFYGILSIIMLASYPIFIFGVTSSGFGILNLFFILSVFWALYRFLYQQTVDHAEFLFLTLVLLAQCRYESLIFFIALLIIMPALINKKIILKYRFISFVFPFFVLPVIWQRRFFLQICDPVRIGHQLYEKTAHKFSLTNLTSNFSENIFVFSGMDSRFGFLPILSFFAVIGGYLLLKRYFLQFTDIDPNNRRLALFGFFYVCSLFLIHCLHHCGNYTDPITNRFAIVFLPVFIFFALYCIHQRFKAPGRYAKIVITLLVVVQLIFYWPVTASQSILQGLSLTYEYERTINYLYSTYDTDNEKLLIISDLPNLYVIHEIGSINFDNANKHLNKIKLYHQIYYDHVIVLQRYSLKNDNPKQNNILNSSFQLRQVSRINISPQFYIKISEITKIL